MRGFTVFEILSVIILFLGGCADRYPEQYPLALGGPAPDAESLKAKIPAEFDTQQDCGYSWSGGQAEHQSPRGSGWQRYTEYNIRCDKQPKYDQYGGGYYSPGLY